MSTHEETHAVGDLAISRSMVVHASREGTLQGRMLYASESLTIRRQGERHLIAPEIWSLGGNKQQ